jgi:hypothetical protein
MQIHEITKAPLQEGFFDMMSPAASAARSAKKLQAKGYGQDKPLPTVQDAIKAVQQNPAQQQYIKGLVAQWPQAAPKADPVVAPTGSTPPPGGKVKPTPTVTVGGKTLTKGDEGLWYSEDGRAVTDPALIAKFEKAYYTGMPNIKGTVNEKKSTRNQRRANARNKAATSAQPAAPDTATTGYRDAFVKWAAGKLRTVDPYTRQTITVDQLTDIKDELAQALAQVVATADNPQGNAVAVNNYLTIAVAGVARESQRLKSKNNDSGGNTSAGPAGGAIVTQQDIRDKIAQANFTPSQIELLKQLQQDPATRRAWLKNLGITI